MARCDDGGNYTLDRKSGNYGALASSTGGYFSAPSLQAGELRPRRRQGRLELRRWLSELPASRRRRLRLGDRAAPAQRGFRRRGSRPGAARAGRDVVAAIADGIGGAKGGRVAAETAVRGFLDGFWDVPETMEVRRAGADPRRAQRLDPLPRQARSPTGHGLHLHRAGAARPHRPCAACRRHPRLPAQRRPPDPALPPTTCATAPAVAHALPGAGRRDRAAARLREPADGAARSLPALQRRRAWLLLAETIADILRERSAPEDTAARWSTPRSLPAAPTTAPRWCSTWSACRPRVADIGAGDRAAAVIPVPQGGDTVDGFVLKVLLSDGRYSRLFGAVDEVEGGEVALKFPKPQSPRRDLPRGLRARGLGGRAGDSPGSATYRAAAGAADLPLHGDAALPGRALEVRLARRPGSVWRKAATSRSSSRGRRRRCTGPASSIATSSPTT